MDLGAKIYAIIGDMYDNQYSWNYHVNSCIDGYLQSQICTVFDFFKL